MNLCLGCMEEIEEGYDVCPRCGYHKDTPVKEGYYLLPGTILHQRYVVGRVLGYGGFGVTYIGWDAQLRRKLAIKEYLPSDFSTRSYGETRLTVFSGDALEQFKAGLVSFIDEAKRLAKLKTIPGIVGIYDSFIENDTGYIIMEYLDGKTVKEILQTRKQLTWQEALGFVTEVLKGLEKVHAEGIIHRDIAPDNIFITKDGQIKLIDFGAARYATSLQSKSLSVILKPGYAPEEQYRSRGEQGPWTDVYGIGATFYKMLTGITPIESIERSVHDTLLPPSKYGVEIPEDVENTLMNSLNVKKEYRIQSATEFLESLNSTGVVWNKPENQEPENYKKMPKWLIAALSSLGVVIVGAAVAMAIQSGRKVDTIAGEDTIPGLVNLSYEEAESKVQGLGIPLMQDNLTYDDDIERDKILSQTPEEGSSADGVDTIMLSMSGGKQYFYMPGVIGLEKEYASKTIREESRTMKDLEPAKTYTGEVTYEYESSETVSKNNVISQSIEESEKVDYDQDIVLTVSSGSETDTDSVVVTIDKDTTGMEKKKAEAYFKQLGLDTNIVEEHSETVKKGRVISQSPEKGSEALTGVDNVKLVISKGPKTVTVRDLYLQPEKEAKKQLKKLGLKYSVKHASSTSVPAGKVCAQSVAAGKKVKKNTKVTITVSTGRPATTTSTTAGTSGSTSRTTTQPPAATNARTSASTSQTQATTQQKIKSDDGGIDFLD